VVHKVAVEGEALRGLPQVYPVRLDVDITALARKHIASKMLLATLVSIKNILISF